jgi:hypothetical protein
MSKSDLSQSTSFTVFLRKCFDNTINQQLL